MLMMKIWQTQSLLMILFLVVFTGRNGNAQTRDVILANAANAWLQSDYVVSAELYGKALRLDSSDLFSAFRLAESLRFDNRYKEASLVYAHVTKTTSSRVDYPEAWYHLSMMTKQIGDIQHFCQYIDEFLSFAPEGEMRTRAVHEAKVCSSPILSYDTLPVRITRLGSAINTPWSEFGAFQLNDSVLYFSALRPTSASDFQSLAEFDYRSAIYQSEIKGSGFQKGQEMRGGINRKNSHHANITFDQTGKRAFFSRCYDSDEGRMQCGIMVVSKGRRGWSKPQLVSGQVNLPGTTNSQPYYARTETFGVLYFVSDRPGGFGGLDIWYAIDQGDRFSEPVNCGSIINTTGNEVTPFYDTARAVLFFSSDFHLGFGGYDVFSSTGGLSSWDPVKNVGLPLNSPANDYYYTVNPNDSNGYITSNRPGSLHLRGETCCNDIYMVEWIPQEEIPEVIQPPVTEIPDTIQELARRLLPLILFFHNDEPDANTMRVTSTKDFKAALNEYVGLQGLYRTEYARGLEGNQATKAASDIDDFFDQYVLRGYEKLEMLTDYLIADLQAGNSVQLLVSGYCSPLSTNEYNINLARRRIHSLTRYLEQARGGILADYMHGGDSSGVQLLIFEDPVGKEKASPFVSNNPNDLRNSVYSRAAAFERRIEIAMYVSHKPGDLLLISEMPRFSTPSDTVLIPPVKRGERSVIVIPYRNTGKSELMVRNVTFNGEQVWVEWSNEPLLPDMEGKLLVLVHGNDRPGPILETLTIHTNLPEPVKVMMKGEVYE
jgi:hypothetical protein